ncbi:hypothetical protein DBR17_02760 [Sphingomonas sp. HMWF008]|nr:hypothetical protein DBR17_02760 [Sphingomonas sp. HMWF008]
MEAESFEDGGFTGDGGFDGGDGGDGGYGGDDGYSSGSGSDLGDLGGWSLPSTNDYPSGTDVLNEPIPAGSSPPNIAPSNPSLIGPSIGVGGGVSVQPGIYGSVTNPKGGGIGVRATF